MASFGKCASLKQLITTFNGQKLRIVPESGKLCDTTQNTPPLSYRGAMNIKSIMKKHTLKVSFVVCFIFLENFTWLLEPTFFGKLLDALIDKFYNDDLKSDYVLPLSLWIGIYLLNTLGGAFSRFYSGRIYSKIYVDIAGEVIARSTIIGYPPSRTLVRAELAKEFVTFLKDRLPEVIWLFSATFGAIVALFFYDWRISAVSFAIIFPIVFIYNSYRKNVAELQKNLHDNSEDLYKLCEGQNAEVIKAYYYRLVTPQTEIAKWNSLAYTVTKLLMMIILIVVLFISVDVDKFSTGNIYAIVSYLWTFILSTDYLPALMESVTSLIELRERLRRENN
ncbi:MAG: ABC transporter six-transmembrane domain-containing protein [Methylobacter sp.]|nr:ABC transporter six-transmembrane domain-containing protein [Methylobacter sp.]